MTLADYLPIGLMLLLAGAFVTVSLVVSKIFRPDRPTPEKLDPYECGIVPEVEPAQRFPVKFYLVAILFLVFDVELLFLYPWAVSAYALENGVPPAYRDPVFVIMLVFLATLAIAYVYAWRKGVFRWR